jgi:hypothetical protein
MPHSAYCAGLNDLERDNSKWLLTPASKIGSSHAVDPRQIINYLLID